MNPKARTDELLIEELPGETLVYDLKRHKAFCLNRTTALVWRCCDGKQSLEKIASHLDRQIAGGASIGPETTIELVRFALDRLERARLLILPPADDRERMPLSRRALAGRLARVAGGLAALVPVVLSVNAPAAVSAGSCISDDACEKYPSANAGKCCCSNRKKCIGGKCQGERC